MRINDDIGEIAIRAMLASGAWPAVFQSGSARCLWDAASAALERAGFAIVPKEPPWHAQIAGRDAILAEDAELDISTDDARECYRAMLEAMTAGD